MRPGVSIFDELYVISDLHMGGPPGFQIFHKGTRLGKLLSQLAGGDPQRRVGLVLNGDLIDSLPEAIDGYIAVDSAESMMTRLFRDPAFSPVWDGLAEFVHNPGRHLIITLGNHDIELALPHVELQVRQRLAGDDPAAAGRIQFATQGSGFACQVGDARIYCTHGNEVDGWNVVDHDALRELAAGLNAGRPFERRVWNPNAGTRFVIDVMNQIKRKHPFIDLLKPEANTVVGVLLTLDPAAVAAARNGLPIISDRIRGELIRRGLLSAEAGSIDEAVDGSAAAGIAMDQLLGANLRAEIGQNPTAPASADQLLLDVEDDVRQGRGVFEVSDEETLEGELGWWGLIADRLKRVDKAETLRKALLDWVKDDRSFEIDERDSTFTRVVARTGPGVDFIVTGHTHMERAIRIDAGADRYYYNSGTWVRLIQLTERLLSDAEMFRGIFEALAAGSMESLDAARIRYGGTAEALVLDRTTVVRIAEEDGGVVGRLYHAEDAANGDVNLDPVSGSEYWRR